MHLTVARFPVADLSSLSADQLAEKVRDSLGGPDYAPMDRRWEDVAADAEANLAELQTRANQLPEALKVGRAQRLYAAERRLAGLEELLAQTEERVRLLKIYALATEKERDEALGRRHRAEERQHRAEARLAETEEERDDAERRYVACCQEREEVKRLTTYKTIGELQARLAGTQKALGRIVAAADADAALNLRDVAFIARTALTTHPEGKP